MKPLQIQSVVCALLCCAGLSLQQQPTAVTENGPVAGKRIISYGGRPSLAFEGIPFAKPPVGDLRFKEPQALEKKWLGTWNATTLGSPCLQFSQLSDNMKSGNREYKVFGDEDCLFLNIYTPDTGKTNKDVLVFIHGGAFMMGSTTDFGPDFLLDKEDLILVLITYRLGPLGFLSTGDAVIPGNNGLKDQVMALSWIQRNIAAFGGNPAKVTISGLSAGGASVHYHYLSSMSNGLFHRGVSYSGNALCPWALITDAPQKTKKLASLLGCPTTDSLTILKCLRRRPAKQIVSQMKHLQVWLYNPFTVFGPVVEVGSSRPFLDAHPEELLKKGLVKDLPWITGVTTEEGLYPAADFLTNKQLMADLDQRWDGIAPSLLFYNSTVPVEHHGRVAREVRELYLANEAISWETREELVQMLSDRLFVSPAQEAAKLQAASNVQPVYVYQYGWQGQKSLTQLMSGSDAAMGVSHADDVFQFLRYGIDPVIHKDDVSMSNLVIEILQTFMKTGKLPKKLQWKPLTSGQNFAYLNIASADDVKMIEKEIQNLSVLENVFQSHEGPRDEL